jgi:hypothetical protein
MSIQEALQTQTELDIREFYKSHSMDSIVSAIEDILKDNDHVEVLRQNDLFRENVLNLVQFLYIHYLTDRKESVPTEHRATTGTKLLSESSLDRLYNLPA